MSVLFAILTLFDVRQQYLVFKALNRMIVLSTLRSAANLKTKNFIIIFSTYVPSPELMY